MHEHQLDSSFRDPSGFVFTQNGSVYRQINPVYFSIFDQFLQSNLYQALIDKEYIVPHEEIERTSDKIIIKPQQLPLITYPYEWSFSQLLAAATLTLNIQLLALQQGMTLKDGSAYNIQFLGSHPLFIDTLSFEPYREGRPWKAYGQFCRHFVAPLLLMKYVDIRCIQLLQTHLDGIPLDLTSNMLPWKSHWNLFTKLHIHLHARYIAQHDFNTTTKRREATMPLSRLQAMIQDLLGNLEKLTHSQTTEWGDYYQATQNYSADALDQKRKVVRDSIRTISPQCIWDVGGNDGMFSRLAKDICRYVITTDIDLQAIDQSYRTGSSQSEKHVWPLFFDITNPTPSHGIHQSQASLEDRLTVLGVDCILALALIHHLTITHNYPFKFIARFFSQIAPFLIIEFVGPSDSWASELLNRKDDAKDLFAYYNQNEFERVFSSYYSIETKTEIKGTERVLYVMKRNLR